MESAQSVGFVELAQATGPERNHRLQSLLSVVTILRPDAIFVVQDSVVQESSRLLWLQPGVFLLHEAPRPLLRRSQDPAAQPQIEAPPTN